MTGIVFQLENSQSERFVSLDGLDADLTHLISRKAASKDQLNKWCGTEKTRVTDAQ